MAEISNINTNNKRPREEETEEVEVPESPEAKRIRETLFFDGLEDGSEPDNTDLSLVMKSLEEEIFSGPLFLSDPDPDSKQPDLGFLLGASDDELGLPPQPEEGGVVTAHPDVMGCDGSMSDDVEAKIWGLDDDFHFEFGVLDDGGVGFDGSVFESDFTDLTWRTEFLPAN